MSITRKTSSIVCLITACAFAFLGTVLAQAPAPAAAANPSPELVGQLTQQLGVTKAQATGGAGAIFGLAKTKLSPENFNKLAAAVPGMNGFLKAAPAAGQAGQAGSSPIGSLGSMVPGKAGGLASLAGSFNSLGMSPSMVSKFAPVVQNYVGAKGGASTASLLSGVLK